MDDDRYVPLAEIEARIADIEEQLQRLPIEREMLCELRRRAVVLERTETHEDNNAAAGEVKRAEHQIGAKVAILNYLNRYPGSLPAEVASAVEERVRSNAQDKRRMLFSMMYNMVTSGALRRDAGGALSVT